MKKGINCSGFFAPDNLENNTSEGKERRKRKSLKEERRGRVLWPKKKLFYGRILFGGNVFIKPGRYTCMLLLAEDLLAPSPTNTNTYFFFLSSNHLIPEIAFYGNSCTKILLSHRSVN